MQVRGVLLSLVLVGSVAATGVVLFQRSNDLVARPNDSGVGPRATQGGVSIDYPADAPPLGAPLTAWLDLWATGPGGMPPLTEVAAEDGVGYWASEAGGEVAIALDLAEVGGVVQVAQVAVENAQGSHDDVLIVEAVIPAFLEAAGAPPRLAAELGLDDPDTLFGEEPREATAEAEGVVAFLAVNRFGLVVGVTGR